MLYEVITCFVIKGRRLKKKIAEPDSDIGEGFKNGHSHIPVGNTGVDAFIYLFYKSGGNLLLPGRCIDRKQYDCRQQYTACKQT